jgi:hypothetical protein
MRLGNTVDDQERLRVMIHVQGAAGGRGGGQQCNNRVPTV